MNKIVVLLFILLILVVIHSNNIYNNNDKFQNLEASVIYLKAPTKDLIQKMENKVEYSCVNDKCNPVEPFENSSIERFTVEDNINSKLGEMDDLLTNVNGNMQNIYINLIGYYNKDDDKIKDLSGNPYQTNVTQNKYINIYKNTFNNNINQIGTSIDDLEKILGIRENFKESFVNLPSVDKNKINEVSGYIVFS